MSAVVHRELDKDGALSPSRRSYAINTTALADAPPRRQRERSPPRPVRDGVLGDMCAGDNKKSASLGGIVAEIGNLSMHDPCYLMAPPRRSIWQLENLHWQYYADRYFGGDVYRLTGQLDGFCNGSTDLAAPSLGVVKVTIPGLEGEFAFLVDGGASLSLISPELANAISHYVGLSDRKLDAPIFMDTAASEVIVLDSMN